MKKIILVGIFFLTASCEMHGQGVFGGTCVATEYDRSAAQTYYNAFGANLSDADETEARETFGCYYKRWDKVYSYNTFWGEKLVLVRHGEAVTYADRKKKSAAAAKTQFKNYNYYR